jgi:tetratricopeptide (TPR) repeat protein
MERKKHAPTNAGRNVNYKEDMSSINKLIKAGQAAYYRKDFSTAIDLFEKNLDESGDCLHTLGHLAYCYKEKCDLDKSTHYCERALKIDPNYFFAFEVLSEVYAKRNENTKAYQYIQKAMANRPSMPESSGIVSKIVKFILKILGFKNQLNYLKKIWNEPEDIEWLTWAQKFKASYEIKDKIT